MNEASTSQHNRVGLFYRYQIRDPAAPLMVLIHGKAGDEQVMLAFKKAVSEEFSILSLRAPLPDPIGGYSWWLEDIAETKRSASLLHHAIFAFCEEHDLDPLHFYAMGFSQGAAMLSTLMQREPQLITAASLLAGFVLKTRAEAVGPGATEILMVHGTKDEIIPIEAAKAGAAHLRGLGFPVTLVEDSVDHRVGIKGMRALRAFWRKF